MLALLSNEDILTINAPLILKMRDIIFFCGQTTYWAISVYRSLVLLHKGGILQRLRHETMLE
jgi:hypothetical protein